MPQPPQPNPVIGIGNWESGLTGRDLRADLNIEAAERAQGITCLYMVSRKQIVVVIVICKNRPVDVIRIKLVGVHRRAPREKRGLITYAYQGRRALNGAGRLNVSWRNENPRAGHARIPPPVPCVTAGIKVTQIVAYQFRRRSEHISLNHQRARHRKVGMTQRQQRHYQF